MTVLIGIRVRSTPQHHGYIFRANFDRSLLQAVSGQHILTRISIQTAGLAFGGTGLCSYRVRGVGSCAEHLTVESYMVFICQLIFGIPSPSHFFSFYHSRLKTFLFCKSFPPLSCLFSSSGFTTWIPQTVHF